MEKNWKAQDDKGMIKVKCVRSRLTLFPPCYPPPEIGGRKKEN